jgi:hypothetical protein
MGNELIRYCCGRPTAWIWLALGRQETECVWEFVFESKRNEHSTENNEIYDYRLRLGERDLRNVRDGYSGKRWIFDLCVCVQDTPLSVGFWGISRVYI